MSRLRARCPDCRTLTAVALGPAYQCHSCGREFAAGLVRVEGGPALEGVAYPEAATLHAGDDVEGLLPERPLVLGGTVELHERIGVACGAGYVLVEENLVALDDAELTALEARLRGRAASRAVSGAGFPGVSDDAFNGPLVERMAHALGL